MRLGSWNGLVLVLLPVIALATACATDVAQPADASVDTQFTSPARGDASTAVLDAATGSDATRASNDAASTAPDVAGTTPACTPSAPVIPPDDQGQSGTTCMGLRATIVGTAGDDHIVGTAGRDVIVAGAGNDYIDGAGGDDVICAGEGADEVHGGDGNDYIDGGDGPDELYGDDGDDVIHGRAFGDDIHGGAGNDALFGDVLDDHLWGDDGDDLLVGGHGTDVMDGGAGNDWLRGDTNADTFTGGDGDDTASFATATPPGAPDQIPGSDMLDPVEGVRVDLTQGTASGDGVGEPMVGIEHVVGSPFEDLFVGNGSATFEGGYGDDQYTLHGTDHAVPGPGASSCNGAPCANAIAGGRPGGLFAYVDPHPRDTGVVVLGSHGDDHVTITYECGSVRVTATDHATITAGPGCANPDETTVDTVVCRFATPLIYLLAWGDDGNDEFTVGDGFPRDFTSVVDGGEGDDTLHGGNGQDILFGGMRGADHLEGNEADDALLSLSYAADHALDGAHYPGGADVMDAGPGNDQLVADYPCGGHTYIGGPGRDIAGFARSGTRDIHAQLGGAATNVQPFHGYAFNPDACPDFMTWGTRLTGDLEILEGSEGDDLLVGDNGDNTIWGREGNDTLLGDGGDDDLEGLAGNDTLYGGPGQDVLNGGDGSDAIFARDGEQDRAISCGTAGGTVERDAVDPAGANCH